MPIGGARTLGDLVDDCVERLAVERQKCVRTGNYEIARLLTGHGGTGALPDLLAYLSRNYPKRSSPAALDRCRAVYRFDPE